MTSKVKERRECKISEAKKNNNWNEVSRLLNQPIENQERKDRRYGLTSLNNVIPNDGKPTELLDLYPDNTSNPMEQLLVKERNEVLGTALMQLSEEDRYIVIDHIIHNKSFSQLSKETKYKSPKTVKRHYEKALKFLKEELENYF